MVHIVKMQYGFMPRKGTVKCCICFEEFWEKLRAKNKMFFIIVDMEKVFDQMPREVIRFAAKRKGVPEYWWNRVMYPYKGCKTAVSVDGELSSSFSVKVGVQHGSDLSPLLFIMVMDVLTVDVRDGSLGSLMELLFADNPVLCRESLNEVMNKYRERKTAVEEKGSKSKCR